MCSEKWPRNVVSCTIEHNSMSTLYHFRIQIANFSSHKTYIKLKGQKDVPENNRHPKVYFSITYT